MAEDKFQVSDDIQVSLNSVPPVADREFNRLLLIWMVKHILVFVEQNPFEIDEMVFGLSSPTNLVNRLDYLLEELQMLKPSQEIAPAQAE